MKKIVIGLGIIIISIGSIIFGDKIVEAAIAINDPKMRIEIVGEEGTNIITKEVLANNPFDIIIDLDAGGVKTGGSPFEIILKDTKLDLTELEGVNIIAGEFNFIDRSNVPVEITRELDVSNKIINLGDLKYNYNISIKPEGNIREDNTWGPKGKIKLTLQTSLNGVIDLSNKFKVKYKTVPVANLETSEVETSNSNFTLDIKRLNYEIGDITGESKALKTVSFDKFFDLNYKITPGDLSFNRSNNTVEESSINIRERDLIYVIDKAIINQLGGNDEIVKVSIKKSLEKLKETDKDIKTSLVIYSEEAEIISVDGKNSFQIDTLISELDKIESSDKSGNLGDGIRKAKYLANENIESDSSIIIVSAGNPNYYTEISEGNTSMLETRVDKGGINKEDKDKAEEYANNIVNDIVINEEDNTRWYGVNYGIKHEELLLNDLIDKFDGLIPMIKNPYYDDFIKINESARTEISIKAILKAKANEDSGIIVHDDFKEQEIYFNFNKNGNEITAVKNNIDAKVQIKIDRLTSNDANIDVALHSNLEVSLEVELGDEEPQIIIFNKDKGAETINWPVHVTVPYIANVGLFNGEFRLTSPRDGILDEFTEVNEISEHVLDIVDEPELAIENHYVFGAVIKPKVELEIENLIDIEDRCRENCVKCKESDVADDYCEADCDYCDEDCNRECEKCLQGGICYEDECSICDDYEGVGILGLDIYILRDKEFVRYVDSRDNDVELEVDEIYLIVINKYIETEQLNNSYKVGFEVDIDDEECKCISECAKCDDCKDESDDEDCECNENEEDYDFIGITVHPVPKPDHF